MPSPHRAASPPEPQHRQEALARYKAKRDFARTPEPAAGPRAAEAGATADPLYVVQKHAARRLHYDLRLELDGVLKSWAVPAGPSLDPAERRLAVHVEDHPLDYGEFEGVIPKGQYGGGTVMLWDRGTWEPLGEPAADYAEGRLKFRLHGQKLAGGWMLVRMGGRARQEKQEPWLLIKERDAAARPGDGAPPDDDRSVLSGRRMAEIASAGDRVWRSKGTGTRAAAASAREGKRPPPMFVAPQLATLVERTPAGQEWLHEIKHDGYRCQLRIAGGGATIHTRGGHDWTARFGAIVRAAAGLPAPDSLLDGEVVVQNADGVSSFALLKQALSDGADGRMVFYAFDLLFQHGEDLRARPLLERKERLEALLAPLPAGHPIRYSDHIVGGGPEMWRMACRLGAEGSIAKRVDAPYRSGRSPSWQKIKCDNRQEVVIGGYTPLKGQGSGLGALLAGVQEAGGLVYVGKIGTGWDQAGATELLAALEPLRQEAMPFVAVPAVVRRQARWVRPELVAEVRFTGWTADGALRHASWQGLREDRDAATVVRERPVTAAAAEPPAGRSGAPRDAAQPLVLEGVRISSPDRVVLDEPRVTKGDIARYYAAVAAILLPQIAGRPLSVIRCPERLGQGCFYQRHRAQGMPDTVRPVENAGKRGEAAYFAVEDAAGLLALVQFGAIELHPWGARADRPDRPDRLVFDLDPAEGLPWARVIGAAHELRARLAALKLAAFAKTTGGKGLHLVVPIDRRHDWPAAKAFALGVVRAMEQESPGLYTSALAKAARRGRVFIDYLRNERGATAVAAYSLRSRLGAPVAWPVAWEEVTETLDPARFNIETVPGLIGRADPWAELAGLRQRLPRLPDGRGRAGWK